MANEIWAALIGIAGTLGGVWYGARLSRQAARELFIQQAKAEFAASFTNTLTKLHSEGANPGEGRALFILQEDYPAHFAAYLKLRAVASKEQQQAIDQAWKRYAKDDQYEIPEEREFYRFSHVLGPNKDEHQQMLAIKHVNTLLDAIAA